LNTPRILVLAREPAVYLERVRERFQDLVLESCRDYGDLEGVLARFRPTIVLAAKIGLPFPRQVLLEAPSVEWIQTVSAGVDHLLPLAARVKVTSASGIHDEALSDYVIAAVLLWNLHFPRFFRDQQERRWRPDELAPAAGQTLAILGLGNIGTLAASKAKRLGMRVVGLRARPELPSHAADEVYGIERLGEVASRADFLALTVPLTPRTRGLVSGEILGKMKPGSVLINLARGGIVDEAALVKTLREGPLRGAVMDVFATEPLPETSELWALPNLVITPHTGDIQGWQRKVAELFCENLERWLEGAPLRNLVDPERGY
jgi:phosphoglycerate dehydrogenase-like enzyme